MSRASPPVFPRPEQDLEGRRTAPFSPIARSRHAPGGAGNHPEQVLRTPGGERDAQRKGKDEGETNVPNETETEATGNGDDRPVHDARELTNGGTRAWIRLDDKVYALMITRAGKLILTK